MALVVLAVSFVAVIVPTGIYAYALYWFDRYEREPISLLAIAFGWGAFPAILLAVAAGLLSNIPLSVLVPAGAELVSASAVAPIIEEIAKGFIVFVIYWGFRHEFDGPLDGIIYGAVVGYGFAMVENVLYLASAWADGGWGGWAAVLLLRTVVFGLNHAFFTSLVGLGFGLARQSRSEGLRILFPLMGLSAAVSFHAIHNIGASLTSLSCLTLFVSFLSDWGGIMIVFVVILLSLRQERQWLVDELQEEVSTGLISVEEYTMACSQRRRWLAGRNALGAGNWTRARALSRFAGLVTELAFKKHHAREVGDDYAQEIARLREQITLARSAL